MMKAIFDFFYGMVAALLGFTMFVAIPFYVMLLLANAIVTQVF